MTPADYDNLREEHPALALISRMSPKVIQDLREACAGVPRPGKPAHFVRLFQPRFVPLVASGQKRQTIRLLPKRIPRNGDGLSLRCWKGKPYRSPQKLIFETRVKEISILRLDQKGIAMPPGAGSVMHTIGLSIISLTGEIADRFARADGFKDWPEMRDWFKATHGLPFDGIILYW